MSSVYSVFCLSHDPALEATGELSSLSEALEMIRNGNVPYHSGCDFLIGRYSGALIDLACPGGDPSPHAGWHRDPISADVALLRIAALAVARLENVAMLDDADEVAAVKRLPMCWTPTRLARMWPQFGIGQP